MKKEKIAILGGGPGGLATAYFLSSPELKDRYEITIYQSGWRLGGKCASGRNPSVHYRSEEHGAHVIFGSYENSFDFLRSVFKTADRPPDSPFSSCFGQENSAFTKWRSTENSRKKPYTEVTLLENPGSNGWMPWPMFFPTNKKIPGDAIRSDDFEYTIWEMVQDIVHYMHFSLNRLRRDGVQLTETITRDDYSRITRSALKRAHIPRRQEANAYELLTDAKEMIQHRNAPKVEKGKKKTPLTRALAFILRETGKLLAIESSCLTDSQRQAIQELQLWKAISFGILEDGILFRGFGIVDRHEFTRWLKLQDPDPMVWDSRIVRGLYAAPFAYDAADGSRNLSAATALRFLVRLFFDYRGSFAWHMEGGMGETVIMPIYEALQKRGVKIEFLHKVEELIPGKKGRKSKHRIEEVTLTRQADLREDLEKYDPKIIVKGVPCWTAEPDYNQLDPEQSQVLKKFAAQGLNIDSHWLPRQIWQKTVTLERGIHFDQLVLAIPPAAQKTVCKRLIKTNRVWRKMAKHIQTIQTQSLQLYTRRTAPEMGWKGSQPGFSLAFERPFDSWIDYSQVLNWENFPKSHGFKQAVYLYDALHDAPHIPEPGDDDALCFPNSQRERVEEHSRDYLRRLKNIWPDFKAEDLSGETPPKEFDLKDQFVRANINPTDRYTLSPPGLGKRRMKAGASTYRNLTLAGDWVDNLVHVGSFEGTIMSAKMASRAISGFPKHIYAEKDVTAGKGPAKYFFYAICVIRRTYRRVISHRVITVTSYQSNDTI